MRRVTAAVLGALALAAVSVMPAQAEADHQEATDQIQPAEPTECPEEADQSDETGTPTPTDPCPTTEGDDATGHSENGSEPGNDTGTDDGANAGDEAGTEGRPEVGTDWDDDAGSDTGTDRDSKADDKSSACDAYVNSGAWCQDGVDDYNCPDIDDAHKPIELVDPDNDPFRLDGNDNDGLGCEVDTGGDSGTDDGADDEPDENVNEDADEGDPPASESGGDDDAADTEDSDDNGTGQDRELRDPLPDTGAEMALLPVAVIMLLGGMALVARRKAIALR